MLDMTTMTNLVLAYGSLDNNGNEIDPTCGVYEVYAGQPNQNFQECI